MRGFAPRLLVALLAIAGCGGEGDEVGTRATPSTRPASEKNQLHVQGRPPTAGSLIGDWKAEGDRLVARFNRDGTFAVDTDGSVEPPGVRGDYTLDGRVMSFTPAGTRCTGWTWQVGLTDDGLLEVYQLTAGCGSLAGSRWTFFKRFIQGR